MTRVRVLLAEDHETVREGLKLLLAAQPELEVVGEASDGAAAVELAMTLRPEVVLMDVSMPRMNGLAATEALARDRPEIKVIALTRHADEGYLQQLLRAGAVGYVLKQSPVTELLHAIRAVAAGGRYLDPAVAGKVMSGFAGKWNRPSGSDAGPGLSPRETEVLRLLAWGHSNKEIAARLDLSVKTVEAHKAHAMQKLDMKSRVDIVRFAILQGWLQEE